MRRLLIATAQVDRYHKVGKLIGTLDVKLCWSSLGVLELSWRDNKCNYDDYGVCCVDLSRLVGMLLLRWTSCQRRVRIGWEKKTSRLCVDSLATVEATTESLSSFDNERWVLYRHRHLFGVRVDDSFT